MKIGFVVNDVMTEEKGFTTVRLAHEAHKQGHDAYLIGVGDLAYDPDEFVRAALVLCRRIRSTLRMRPSSKISRGPRQRKSVLRSMSLMSSCSETFLPTIT